MDPVIQQRIARLARRLPDAYLGGSPRNGSLLFSHHVEEICPGIKRVVYRPIDPRAKLAMFSQSNRGLELFLYVSPENDISFWARIDDDNGAGYLPPEEWTLEQVTNVLKGSLQVALAKKLPPPYIQDRDDLIAWVYRLFVDLGFDQKSARNLVAGHTGQYELLSLWWLIDYLTQRINKGADFDGVADTLVGILRTSRHLKPLEQIEFYDYDFDKVERALTSIGAALPPPVTHLGPNDPNAVPIGHLVDVIQLLEEESSREVLRGLSQPEIITEKAAASA